MENAKIGIVEDVEPIAHLTISHLKSLGHEIIFHATTREEALEYIDRIEAGEIKVDVYLVDGKLSESSAIGEDAAVISEEIERRGLSGTVIGFSADELTEGAFHYQAAGKKLEIVEEIIESQPDSAKSSSLQE